MDAFICSLMSQGSSGKFTPGIEAEASRTGLIAALGPERVFKSVEEAVRRIGPDSKLVPATL
jgi:hypothetical protein